MSIQTNDLQSESTDINPKLHDISTYLFNAMDCIDENGFLNSDFIITDDFSIELFEKIENYINDNSVKFGDILFTGTFNKSNPEENVGFSSNDIGFLFVLDEDTILCPPFTPWRNCKSWTQHLCPSIEFKFKEQKLYYNDFFYSLRQDPKISQHLKYSYTLDDQVLDIYDNKHILRPNN